jgi:hypothetical protein
MQSKINLLKTKISFHLRKQVTKKYVIFESDDWGLERAKDDNALQTIIDKYSKNKISRWTTDAIESVEDLEMLFQLFDTFKNKFEHNPVLTANFITHNIDYSSQDVLQFKPISEGYNFGDNNLFAKYKEGVEKNYFIPQLHGFSHYNTKVLEKDFHSKNFQEDFTIGFPMAKSTIKGSLQLYRGECFDPNFEITIKTATNVFKDVFGYYSKTFIPPNYLYDDKQNSILYANHIEQLQSSAHFLTQKGKNTIHPYFRKNNNLLYSVRGGRLDTHPDYNFLAEQCIKEIEAMFSYKTPAIIDVHRVNFSGKYFPETRQKTIEEMHKVLLYLYKNHPDVIFISSDALEGILNN